jgi:glycosyltransferase A (GT-A) superfamily protein (DUF2064 family)
MYDLNRQNLEEAFLALEKNDYVVGPALDGGYYLLGMKKYKEDLFKNKDWGTASVQEATLKDLKQEGLQLLTEKNDVDHFEDIKDIEAFGPYLKHM